MKTKTKACNQKNTKETLHQTNRTCNSKNPKHHLTRTASWFHLERTSWSSTMRNHRNKSATTFFFCLNICLRKTETCQGHFYIRFHSILRFRKLQGGQKNHSPTIYIFVCSLYQRRFNLVARISHCRDFRTISQRSQHKNMINFYVRGKVRRLRAFSMAKEHWFRTWLILRELAVFNKKLSVYYVGTRLSRDKCNAQQIRAALR